MKVCNSCKIEKEDSSFDKRKKNGYLQSDCRSCNTLKSKARYMAAKELVFLALGARCCHCGFADKKALQIDHKDGGGCRQRRAGLDMTSIQYLKYVATHPDLFQILCANCNWIKRAENKEDKRWKLLELPLNLQMVALKTASSFAVKNTTGFLTEDRLLQLAAPIAGEPTILDKSPEKGEILRSWLINWSLL